MMNHPVMKMACMIAWAITGIFSLNVLTAMWGCDVYAWLVNMMPGMEMALIWIIGLSGLISLIAFFNAMFMCCPGCGSCPCKCNKSYNNM